MSVEPPVSPQFRSSGIHLINSSTRSKTDSVRRQIREQEVKVSNEIVELKTAINVLIRIHYVPPQISYLSEFLHISTPKYSSQQRLVSTLRLYKNGLRCLTREWEQKSTISPPGYTDVFLNTHFTAPVLTNPLCAYCTQFIVIAFPYDVFHNIVTDLMYRLRKCFCSWYATRKPWAQMKG
jgi:hypothetical protein